MNSPHSRSGRPDDPVWLRFLIYLVVVLLCMEVISAIYAKARPILLDVAIFVVAVTFHSELQAFLERYATVLS